MKTKIIFLTIALFLIFSFCQSAKAAYSSQCKEGQSGGSQTDCTHSADTEILNSQCKVQYSSDSCGSMPAYLNALQGTCISKKPSGIDCGMIPQNGYYGREAAKMAAYVESNPQGGNTCDTVCADMNQGDMCYCGGMKGNCSSAKICEIACAEGDDGMYCYAGGKSGVCSKGFCDTAGKTGNPDPTTPTTICGQGYVQNGDFCFPSNTGLPDVSGGVIKIVSNILYWLLSIFGILAIIAFIISGIQYILSAGDEKAIDTAKASMRYAIIGVVVALSGLVIIFAINKLLSGTATYF